MAERRACRVTAVRTVMLVIAALLPAVRAFAADVSAPAAAPAPATTASRSSTSPANQLPAEVERVLRWLPPDSQTLLVHRNPDRAIRAIAKLPADARQPNAADLRYVLPAALLGANVAPIAPDLARFLAGQSVEVVVEGSRRFHAPINLGLMPYQGAHIVVLKRDPGDEGAKFMNDMGARTRLPREIIEGQEVLHFKTDPQPPIVRDVWDIYLARPLPEVFILATDQSYLRELLERLNSPVVLTAPRAFAADLPEWREIDTSQPFWALRHYDRADAAGDPTSPFGGRKSANVPDDRAIGVALSYDPEKSPLPAVRYLSADHARIAEIAHSQWSHPSEHLTPQFRQRAPGVIEIAPAAAAAAAASEPQDRARGDGMYLFVLMVVLGHCVMI
jgi:hypothetical protein